MEFPAPYHTTPESRWAKLASNRKRNPKRIPKPIKAMRTDGEVAMRKGRVGAIREEGNDSIPLKRSE